MRVLVISDEAIFPVFNGGRLAILNEVIALQSQGVVVSVVIFHREPILARDREAHYSLCSSVYFIARKGFLKATLRSPKSSYQYSSRDVKASPTLLRWAKDASAIVCHHEWVLPLGVQLRQEAAAPLVLRSHNDELNFFKVFYEEADGARKAYNFLEYYRLRQDFKRSPADCANQVWVMTAEDANAYASLSTSRVRHVRPTMVLESSAEIRLLPPSNLVGFIGALNIPHTAKGLLWFVDKVWPRICERVEDAHFYVAGRGSSAALRKILSETPSCTFLGEIDTLEPLLSKLKVFVNPVFGGSGVNMKLAGPLSHGIPTVTTKFGARGFRSNEPGLIVGDSAEMLAGQCSDILLDSVQFKKASKSAADLASEFSTRVTGQRMIELLEECGVR